MTLIGKIFITGQIVAETGLHIGGSKASLDIGGVDLNVIKTHDGRPFIPGSSLKGKLRSLLARLEGSLTIARSAKQPKSELRSDEDVRYLCAIFGLAGDQSKQEAQQELTRLLVRDAFLDAAASPRQEEYTDMELPYTDVKFENSIDRKRGVAQHPRQLERVPPGAHFRFELVLDVYEQDQMAYVPLAGERLQPQAGASARDHYLHALRTAMMLLQDDYLGGQGSRGYGKVKFDQVQVKIKKIGNSQYEIAENDGVLNAFAEPFTA